MFTTTEENEAAKCHCLVNSGFSRKTNFALPCKQWFLQARRYATKGEKPLRASVAFFDRAAVQRYGGIY